MFVVLQLGLCRKPSDAPSLYLHVSVCMSIYLLSVCLSDTPLPAPLRVGLLSLR